MQDEVGVKHFVRTMTRRMGYEVRKVPRAAEDRTEIHFLHIGKNAGTQISHLAAQVNRRSATSRIVSRSHDVYLRDIPEDVDYFFSIREPVSRFRSGFYSRKRKGQPRIYSEWTPHDEVAFAEFEHANDLAESLFEAGPVGHRAWAAMKSIRHAAQNQSDWFYCCGNFLSVRPPIWILRQHSLESDFRTFIKKSALDVGPDDVLATKDGTAAHRNSYEGLPPLSEKAVGNLRRWYAQDVEFYSLCEQWIADNAEGG